MLEKKRRLLHNQHEKNFDKTVAEISEEETKKVAFVPDEAEQELINAVAEKGEDGLAEFFMQNRGRLHRMISMRIDQRLAQRVDASDVLQEGFVDAAKRLNEFIEKPPMPLFVWLRFLIGQKLAAVHRWHFNAQKRDPRKEDTAASQRMPSADSQVIAREFSASMTSPSQAVVRAEMSEKLARVLDTLESIDREILVMRHFEELSNNEAAAELGITKGTASKRYVRALAKLNKAMAADPNVIPEV